MDTLQAAEVALFHAHYRVPTGHYETTEVKIAKKRSFKLTTVETISTLTLAVLEGDIVDSLCGIVIIKKSEESNDVIYWYQDENCIPVRADGKITILQKLYEDWADDLIDADDMVNKYGMSYDRAGIIFSHAGVPNTGKLKRKDALIDSVEWANTGKV